MKEEEGRTLIRKLSEGGIFNIIITGGEPLLNFNTLIAVAEEAKKLGIRYSLNSNIISLDEKKAKKLVELGIKNVLASVPGVGDTYDLITQRPGAYQIFLKKLNIARRCGIEVTPNMVVTKKNLSQMYETASQLKKLGFKRFMSGKAACPGNCQDFSEFMLSQIEFEEYLKTLKSVKDNLKMEVDTLSCYPLCGTDYPDDYASIILGRNCTAGVSFGAISVNGDVRPCPQIDTVYGNLFTENMFSIWKKASEWRKGENIPDACNKCSLLKYCGGGCRMEAKMSGGNYSENDPYCRPEKISETAVKMKRKNKLFPVKELPEFNHWEISPYHYRKESFGGTVCLQNSDATLLLDSDGLAVFLQFQPGKIYNFSDTIDWKGLEPKEFLSNLYQRGAIIIRGEKNEREM
jgi:radical SAM protein with 4Fe4S-binding SPASM domain